MKKYDCIFLDRDGTLNPDPGYISSLNDFIFYDFTLPALKQLAKAGNRFCIITNQSGISRGLIQQEHLQEIHDFITMEFEKNNIESIIDDTDENFSSKIKKMNLIGAPYQIIIGKKSDGDLLEFKETGGDTQNLSLDKIIEIITKQKVTN